ncbi:MAG: response regulator [Planctomycetota bacterium]
MIKPLNSSTLPINDTPLATDRPATSRILLVDDEQSIIASLKRLFRREGYELHTANSGDEALAMIDQQGPFDLVMSDFRMPGMTGAELLRKVRDRSPDTIRIILSGYSEVHAIIDAINDGAIYKYLTKPWNDEEIKLHLRRAMEQRLLKNANAKLAAEVSRQNQKLRELNNQLDRRAQDAGLGLSFTQELMEYIHAGVLCIDPHGLVVGANTRMSELLADQPIEIIGLPMQEVLPEAVCDVLPDVLACPPLSAGRVGFNGHEMQWSCRPFQRGADVRGQVITFWEDAS